MLLAEKNQSQFKLVMVSLCLRSSPATFAASRCPDAGGISGPRFTETKPQITLRPIGAYCVGPSCKSQTSLGVVLPASSVFLTPASSQLPLHFQLLSPSLFGGSQLLILPHV